MTATAAISRLVWISFGYVLPAYRSFKAIQSKDFKKLTRFLVIWIVIGLVSAAEPFVDTFVSWVPLYHELKLLTILFLLFPEGRGAVYIYKRLILPFFLEKEEDIDQTLLDLQTNFTAVSSNAVKQGAIVLQQAALEAFKKGHLALTQGPSAPGEASEKKPKSKELELANITELLEETPVPEPLEPPKSGKPTVVRSASTFSANVPPTASAESLSEQSKREEPTRTQSPAPTPSPAPSPVSTPAPVPAATVPLKAPERRTVEKRSDSEERKVYEAIVRDWVWEIEHFDEPDVLTDTQKREQKALTDSIFSPEVLYSFIQPLIYGSQTATPAPTPEVVSKQQQALASSSTPSLEGSASTDSLNQKPTDSTAKPAPRKPKTPTPPPAPRSTSWFW